jgi:hypothetical protein
MTRLLGCFCIATAVLAFGACDGDRTSPPARSPAAPTPAVPTPPAPPPAPIQTRYYLSGRVTDQADSPLSGVGVELDYPKAGGESSPPSHCPSFGTFCWLTTLTNDRGDYAVEFEPSAWSSSSVYGGGIGYVYSFHEGYETDIQWVPTGSTTGVQNLRLRPVRRLNAGASTVVSVEPDSSLCSDLEDLWVLNSRCEVVRVEATAGTLVVEARAAEAGGVMPLVFWATSGNYAGLITRPGPGTVSIPVRGGTYQIFVGIPDGIPSQRFDVLTSLR